MIAFPTEPYSPCQPVPVTDRCDPLENDPIAAKAGGDRELPRGAFPATRWSLVARLSEDGDESRARAALEDLCQIYWFPLYAYARRSGKDVADAEDLTQAYFAKLLEKGFFAGADKRKGKLRSFLSVSYTHLTLPTTPYV